MKTEIFTGLHFTSNEKIDKEIEAYIVLSNKEHLAYSLNYLTPKQYREYYVQK